MLNWFFIICKWELFYFTFQRAFIHSFQLQTEICMHQIEVENMNWKEKTICSELTCVNLNDFHTNNISWNRFRSIALQRILFSASEAKSQELNCFLSIIICRMGEKSWNCALLSSHAEIIGFECINRKLTTIHQFTGDTAFTSTFTFTQSHSYREKEQKTIYSAFWNWFRWIGIFVFFLSSCTRRAFISVLFFLALLFGEINQLYNYPIRNDGIARKCIAVHSTAQHIAV